MDTDRVDRLADISRKVKENIAIVSGDKVQSEGNVKSTVNSMRDKAEELFGRSTRHYRRVK